MDPALLRTKAAQAERALRRVQARLPRSVKSFGADYDAQDIVYRNFQNLLSRLAPAQDDGRGV